VAERELAEVIKHDQWQLVELQSNNVEAFGGGNVMSLRMQYQQHTEVIEMYGKVGVSAESIAKQLMKKWWRYQSSGAAVGVHLADQLLLPMAMAEEGVFTTLTPCSHTETNRHVIEKFIDKVFEVKELAADLWQIRL
jgi:RNA 3'-terminal phosphate cyclase (ATP)